MHVLRTMQIGFDLGSSNTSKMSVILHDVIEDRGSRYTVSFGCVYTRADIGKFLTHIKKEECMQVATHHSWAVRIVRDGVLYESNIDDGETGAGMVILREMRKADVINTVVCVTRWFGGVKLMQDRFKHVQDATRIAIAEIQKG